MQGTTIYRKQEQAYRNFALRKNSDIVDFGYLHEVTSDFRISRVPRTESVQTRRYAIKRLVKLTTRNYSYINCIWFKS
jgi:hypothetical protein